MPSTCPDTGPALAPASALQSALLAALRGDPAAVVLRLADGRAMPLAVERWAAPADPADHTLLSRARGPVLDLGCGPGRLTAALHARGVDVLGVELLAAVPQLARRAGAPVHVGDLFGPLPRERRWRTVLLADGNVGIGGDVVRLLRRVAGLLAPDGVLLCEVQPRGTPVSAPHCGPVRLESGGSASSWFRWALVGRGGVAAAAEPAGLAVVEQWTAGGRAFAALSPG